MSENSNTLSTEGLVIRNLVKKYGDKAVVDNISLTLEKGKMLTLLGPSGCGKTTTLRMIAGLESVTAGEILLLGRDITNMDASKRNIGMVFQSYALFPHMSVFENVSYGLVEAGIQKDQRADMVSDILKTVGLTGMDRRLPHQLSGGQQQRVALARSLITKPTLLLFDEPLSNLDMALRSDIRMEIRDLQRDFGLTSVYVTHDQEEALAISDEIVVMNDGVIEQQDTPRQFYIRPKTEFIARFMGNASVLEAEIIEIKDDTAFLDICGNKFNVPLYGREASKGKARVAVRPFDVKVAEASDSEPGIPAKVIRSSYLGSHTHVKAKTQVGIVELMDISCSEFAGDIRLIISQDKIALIT